MGGSISLLKREAPRGPPQPPSKKARRDPPERPTDGDKKRLGFDLLSDNANENIVRFLSARPNYKAWPVLIKERELAWKYHVDGDFGRCISSLFNSICISDGAPETTPPGSPNNWIFITNRGNAFKILKRGGENIKSIYMDDDYARGFWLADQLTAISQACPNLETFITNGNNGMQILAALGGRLKKLRVDVPMHNDSILAIPSYCTNIRELTLTDVDTSAVAGSSIWEKIGLTLEVIEIDTFEHKEVGEIQQHCRKLKKIDIEYFFPTYTEVVPECLASFKGQLEYATLYAMKESELKSVVESCKNARFSLILRDDQICDHYMGIIGSKLESVILEDYYPEEHGVNVVSQGSIWDSCPNIQNFHVNDSLGLKQVESQTNSPKLFVEKLQLRCYGKGTNVKNVVKKICGASVTGLRQMNLVCNFPPANSFDALVQMNKLLSEVSIYIYCETGEKIAEHLVWERVIEITGCFFNASALEYLIIEIVGGSHPPSERNDGLGEMLRLKYRHRRAHVTIFRNVYS